MQSSATRSALPHGIQWHFAAPRENLMSRHEPFRLLQKRCNHVLGQHPAIIDNPFLSKLEQLPVSLASFLEAMNQQAILWRQLVLVREHHALILAEGGTFEEPPPQIQPVAVCFDQAGVPWCPPMPETGLGDPYALSDRLHEWWGGWQKGFPQLAERGYGIKQAAPATRKLCEYLDHYYNANDRSTALGTMVAIESALSTDCWDRLRLTGQRICLQLGQEFPAPGFLTTSEAHARLQARHALHLLAISSHLEEVDEAEFFRAAKACLECLGRFEQGQADLLQPELH